jgi:hypothetical protein
MQYRIDTITVRANNDMDAIQEYHRKKRELKQMTDQIGKGILKSLINIPKIPRASDLVEVTKCHAIPIKMGDGSYEPGDEE